MGIARRDLKIMESNHATNQKLIENKEELKVLNEARIIELALAKR